MFVLFTAGSSKKHESYAFKVESQSFQVDMLCNFRAGSVNDLQCMRYNISFEKQALKWQDIGDDGSESERLKDIYPIMDAFLDDKGYQGISEGLRALTT